MIDENILPFLHNRSAEISVSQFLEDMRSIENNPDKLRLRLHRYKERLAEGVDEDLTPFKIQSILTSVAIVKLSPRMDEIARTHLRRVCSLIDKTGNPNATLFFKFSRIPLINQFKSEVHWIIDQYEQQKKLLTGTRIEGMIKNQRIINENEWQKVTNRSMRNITYIPNKKFEKFITEYTSSNPLLLSIAWVLYYYPNHNRDTTTEVQFDDFLQTLRSNGLVIGRKRGADIAVFSSRYYKKEKETIGLLNIPNSNQNMLSYFLPEHDPDYQKFDKLYSKYIRGLSNCLTFANCSSNLTRVGQLYHRPPKFYPDFVQLDRNIHPKQSESFDTLEVLNRTISTLKSKQRIQTRTTSKLKDYFSKIAKPYNKNLSNKYREIFSNFTDNPILVGDVAATINESPSLADLEQSLKDLDDQLMPAEIFRSERAEIHHEIAKIHRRDGNYDAAYDNNISAINYREEDEDYIGLSRSYNDLGFLELDLGKYSQAEEYFNKSIEIKEEHNLSKDSIIISLKNLGTCYEKSHRFGEQESVLERALNLSIETKNKKRHFELSHLLHEFYEVHNDKDIFVEKSGYDGMLIEHPFYLDSNEILNLDLQGGHSFKPFVIQGSAGMGKTVVMTQIGLQYVTRIKKMLDYDGIGGMLFIPFPIFIKGRNVTPELGNDIEVVETLIFGSNPDLSKYISSDELVDLLDVWKKYSHYHFGSFSIFVDAVDEMKNHEIATNFLDGVTTHRSFRTSRRPLIFISTRPSHTDILPSNCSFSLMRQNYYSKKELSVEMPKKLCDAWGITREITDTFQESFDSYEDILIHPLFVGWFCFLIQQGHEEKMLLIGSNKENNSDEQIGEIEVFDSKLQYRKTTD